MKKSKVVIRPEHHSQYTIEGGEMFALEGIVLGIAGGWWVCDQFGWHWLLGLLMGVCILAGFMWLLTMTVTRWVVFGLNALAGGLLSYLLATALFGATDLTGCFIGVLVAILITIVLIRRFTIFGHDLTMYRRLKDKQTNQEEK